MKRPVRPLDRLTPREREVARMVLAGKTNRQIGAHFVRSEQVIKNWLVVIYNKLGVWNRLELAIMLAPTPQEPFPLYDMATGQELVLERGTHA